MERLDELLMKYSGLVHIIKLSWSSSVMELWWAMAVIDCWHNSNLAN